MWEQGRIKVFPVAMRGVSNIRNFNVVKLDSKGRILIPFHIRELLSLETGSEFVVINNHNGELKVLPLARDKTAEISVMLDDAPGALAKVTEMMSKKNVDIIMSQSKTLERGQIAEWHAIVDISNCKDFKKISNELSHVKVVKKIEIFEK